MNQSLSDILSTGRNQALKTLAIGAGMLVYLGAIVYAGVHNWRLMTQGIQPDMVLWAALGVLALEISALALPIALHYWCHDPMQRIFAYGFYGVDLALIFANVILDYSLNTGGILPTWLETYRYFGVPATPVITGMGWSLLFLLDPAQKELAAFAALQTGARITLAKRIADHAGDANIDLLMEETAQSMAYDVVAGVLPKKRLPANIANSDGNREPNPTLPPRS